MNEVDIVMVVIAALIVGSLIAAALHHKEKPPVEFWLVDGDLTATCTKCYSKLAFSQGLDAYKISTMRCHCCHEREKNK